MSYTVACGRVAVAAVCFVQHSQRCEHLMMPSGKPAVGGVIDHLTSVAFCRGLLSVVVCSLLSKLFCRTAKRMAEKSMVAEGVKEAGTACAPPLVPEKD